MRKKVLRIVMCSFTPFIVNVVQNGQEFSGLSSLGEQ